MPSLFVAGRDSRHRAACFALYRALIQQGLRVPLPDHVLSATGLEGPVHPIKHLIRKSFRRNKNDSSPRLVISALRNGYKFLDMLSAAQSRSSPEYESILAFIHGRQLEKLKALEVRSQRDPPPPKPSSAPNPNTIPLLTRVSKPGEEPRYESTIRPRPLSELGGSGRRRVPVLENANALPFLRLTKPQPAIVSRIIRQKSRRETRVIELLQFISENSREAAEWEDQWEAILERSGANAGSRSSRRTGSFQAGVKQDIHYMRRRLLQLRVDDHARGVALQKIVQEERALAEKENVERKERRRKEKEAQRASGSKSLSSTQEVVDAIRGSQGDAKTR